MVGPDSSHGVSRVVHHKDFYLRGGDLTVIVENHLFRIHSYFFHRESLFFRQKLDSLNANGQEVGLTDNDAFTLEGDIKSEEFARFLWVFYNPKYSVYEAPLETWLSILKLANRWNFDNVKELAVRELEKIPIEAVQKISIYQSNNISRLYLIPSYVAICKRDKPLSFSEGMGLGMETVLRIAEARERLRLQASESGIRTPTFEDFEDNEVEVLIREIFQLGPRPAASTPTVPATNAVNGSTTIKLNAAPTGNHPKANGASASRANGGSAADPKRSSVDSLPSIASVIPPQAPGTSPPKPEPSTVGTQSTAPPPDQALAPLPPTQGTSTPQSAPPPPPAADKPKDKEAGPARPSSAASTRTPKSAVGAGEPSSSDCSAGSQPCDVSITKPDVVSSEQSSVLPAECNNNVNEGGKDELLKDNDTGSVFSDTDGGKASKSGGRNKKTKGPVVGRTKKDR